MGGSEWWGKLKMVGGRGGGKAGRVNICPAGTSYNRASRAQACQMRIEKEREVWMRCVSGEMWNLHSLSQRELRSSLPPRASSTLRRPRTLRSRSSARPPAIALRIRMWSASPPHLRPASKQISITWTPHPAHPRWPLVSYPNWPTSTDAFLDQLELQLLDSKAYLARGCPVRGGEWLDAHPCQNE